MTNLDLRIDLMNCKAFGGLTVRVTSPYGRRKHPVTGKEQNHTGVDITPVYGPQNAPVTATADGVVIDFDDHVKGYDEKYTKGNYIRLRHVDGSNTMYLHLKDVYVKNGDVVAAGTVIGISGDTGQTTGAHLHYQVYNPSGAIINPLR